MQGSAGTASVFWSGGEMARKSAEKYAQSSGSKTLEMILKEIFLIKQQK